MPKLKVKDLNLNEMFEKFQGETDRSAAIIAACNLEILLEDFIKINILDEAKLHSELFDYYKPLNSFAAKITILYAFKLIDKEAYDTLNIIRDIRNKFAHSSTLLSFEEDPIKSYCDRFIIKKDISFPNIALKLDCRIQYILHLALLTQAIKYHIEFGISEIISLPKFS